MATNSIKRYEGWLRLALTVFPMIAGYFDLRYTAKDALVKINRMEYESDRRSETLNQLAIDVAVLKAWAHDVSRGKIPTPP